MTEPDIAGFWVELASGIYEGRPIDNEFRSLLRISNIPPITIITHRIETWKSLADQTWWKEIKDYAQGIFSHPFLTLHGQRGVGKTHLALAIGFEWMARHKTVLYYRAESLLDKLRDGFSTRLQEEQESYHSVMNFAEKASLFILDDLGGEKQSDWVAVKLDQIIDTRYIEKRPLIVTTNLTSEGLPPRIADRLSEGHRIHIKGESYRKKINKQACE